jgi:hypothetical protein
MISRLSFLLILFFTLKGFANEAELSNVAKNMREKTNLLGKEKNFCFVDLGISEEDLELIQQLNITASGQYNRFGNLHLLRDELPHFLRKNCSNSEPLTQKIADIIFQIASHVQKASNKETAWICVRVSTPNPAFDMPRWHQDGYYYSPYAGFAFKFAVALKGNPTLFYQLPQEMRELFHSSSDREFLSTLLKRDKIESPKSGLGVFFLVGDKESAAIHSEPKIDSERLFFSVLPGNENEISELKDRWQN